jgi:hypothetical protein
LTAPNVVNGLALAGARMMSASSARMLEHATLVTTPPPPWWPCTVALRRPTCPYGGSYFQVRLLDCPPRPSATSSTRASQANLSFPSSGSSRPGSRPRSRSCVSPSSCARTAVAESQ